MNANQYRKALEDLGLTQAGFARLLGRGDRTSRRWALDEAKVPPEVEIILRAMAKGLLTVEQIEKLRAR